jgi:hypothetical protein
MDGIAEKRSFTDSKTALQEIAQSRGLPVEYLLLSAEGPDHDRTYEYAVLIGGTEEGRGTGHSKKAAEQAAADDNAAQTTPVSAQTADVEQPLERQGRQIRYMDPYEEVKKLKELLDMGIVTEEEFQKKKKELLNL